MQRKLIWSAVLGGLLVANGPLRAGGFGGPAGNSGNGGNGGGAAVGAASSGGAHGGSGGERSSGPGEGARVTQAAPAARGVAYQNVANQRAVVANQAYARGGENGVATRDSGAGDAGVAPRALRYGNAWTDPAGTGQRQRFYNTSQISGRQNGSGRRSRGYQPYLAQYYGGYYPIYVDAPYAGDFGDGDATLNSGYDGGPAAVPDPGDPANGVGPVLAPSSIMVSPQNGDGTQPAPDAAASGSQDTAQNPDHTPNPAIGPDSLVEAVQAELTRRGYFQGKVDAMFRSDTQAALRHFQQDNYLAPTGHLNEATLHALNLD